ncbi:hypothetical protein ACFRCI_17115 [Streptomyces sp. NPDC056638]|uniref:hypothetical protein n=1 Tax=Streptomyces sp. NPDC056638 TaxID=3345887 RepID=UPI00369E71FD
MPVELDWEYLSNLANRVAYSISTKWPVEKDDTKQEILSHAYKKRSSIEENYGREDVLYKIFHKAGTQYASAERDALDLRDGRYYYTPEEAKMALSSFCLSDEEIGQMLGRGDDLLGCRVTDNLMSARMDASLALPRLPERQRELLMSRYVQGLPTPTDEAERRATLRALDMLARQMNRDIRRGT